MTRITLDCAMRSDPLSPDVWVARRHPPLSSSVEQAEGPTHALTRRDGKGSHADV
jgi:hypothetical protein